MRCRNCNETDHGFGAKFCHMCGFELYVEQEAGEIGNLVHKIEWVDAIDFDEGYYKRITTDRFNLSQLLFELDDYVASHHDMFDASILSVYIEEIEFKTFIIHIYNTNNKKVMQMRDGFDYYISTKSLYNAKNIKGIFKNEKHSAITCRFDRIAKLQERILDNTLTF